MGWFKPKISTFEASVNRDGKGRITSIDTYELSAKEIKELDKLEKKCTEGERGLKAFRAGVSDILKGHGDSKNSRYNDMIKQHVQTRSRAGEKPSAPMHPSVYKRLVQQGKQPVTIQQALRIKDTDPKTYEAILHREAKRQGLI